MPMKQWKLYGDIGFGSLNLTPILDPTGYSYFPDRTDASTFPTLNESSKFSSVKFSVGLLKEYPFMRNFLFGWSAGWGAETLKWSDGSDLEEKLISSGLQFGARVGMNIKSPSVQLIGSINYHGSGAVTPQYKPKDQDMVSGETIDKWTTIFESKSQVGINLSLRFNF
jgi:hypothetical protein